VFAQRLFALPLQPLSGVAAPPAPGPAGLGRLLLLVQAL
jgi:hypothetical protein